MSNMLLKVKLTSFSIYVKKILFALCLMKAPVIAAERIASARLYDNFLNG
jgi:hypothetical protein